MHKPLLFALCAVSLTGLCAGTPQEAGFTEAPLVSSSALNDATGLAWAADGSNRLFVTLKAGSVRVIKNGALLATPFATESVTTSSECGLIGIAFDPGFASNGYVYLFMTVSTSEQQIVRYTASGDTGTARTVIKGGLPTLGNNHDGGAIAIGADGKLYWGVGDLGNATGVDSDLGSLAAKIGRANLDGSAPSDNPYYDAGDGITAKDFIFARGFRNPYTMTFHPVTGDLWVNVVGTSYEQIFLVARGDHAGWNNYEGGNQPTGFIRPKLAYQTNNSPYGGCITGGVFYAGSLFPASHQHDFFWGDYNAGKIMRSELDPTHKTITATTEFVTGVSAIVDIAEGPDGALYYVGRGGGAVYRLSYADTTPQNLQLSATALAVAEGGQGTFTVRLAAQPATSLLVSVARSSGDTDVTASPASLTFSGADWSTPKTVTVAAAQDADTVSDGAAVTASASGVSSQSVSVTAIDDDVDPIAPIAQITAPASGATVSGAAAEWYGDGTDDVGTTRADFFVDGLLAYADVGSSGHYHFGGAHNAWDTTKLANGEHTLRMTVIDTGGLSGSHEITVTVRNEAPPVEEPRGPGIDDLDGGVSSTGCTSCAAAGPELVCFVLAWALLRRRRGAWLLLLMCLVPRPALAQYAFVEAHSDAPPRNYVNLRAGASSSSLHPQICLDVAPLERVSLEACGTGSGFLHHDADAELAHFRAEVSLRSWRTELGWMQARVGLGFAELQIGEDDAGFDFRGVGGGASTAGPAASASVRGLVPLTEELELVWDLDVSGAYLAHAPKLDAPRSSAQLSVGATFGVGF